VARLLGVGVRQISKWVSAGRLRRSAGNMFAPEDVRDFIKAKDDGPHDGAEVSLARARAARAVRLLVEKLERQVPAAGVEEEWRDAKRRIVARLALLPDDMGRPLAALDDPNRVADAMAEAIHGLLTSLSSEPGIQAEDDDDNGPALPPARTLRDFRQRIAMVRAELIAADERLKSGQDLLLDAVQRRWLEQLYAIRSHLLALPTKLAPLIAVETDPVRVRALLAEALQEITADFEQP
jgi:hypothetical protein